MNLESSQQKFLYFLIIPILGLVLSIYYQVIDFDFLINFDDDMLIMNSPELRDLNWENFKHIFTTFFEGLYHPITSLAWMLQIEYFGLDSHAFHHTSLVFHLLNTFLVFILGKKLSGKVELGLLAALLFGIHPMHVVNISWASAQKDLFVTFFFLLTLINYTSYLRKKETLYYVLTFVFALMAMLSKASAIVIPFLLILMDWLLLEERNWKKMILSKAPFLGMTIVFSIANYIAQSEYGYLSALNEDLGWFDRVLFVFYSAFYYLLKFLVPLDLVPKNLYPEGSSSINILYYLSIPILAMIAFLAYQLKRKELWLVFGLLFYIIAIAPTLKLIPTGNDIVSNRYAYLAYIGLHMALAHYILKLNKISKIVLILVITAFWTKESYSYASTYENSYNVWSKVIEAHEDRKWGLAMAYNERGQVAFKDGKYQAAQSDINRALELDPDLGRALMNRANLYDRAGNFEGALQDLDFLIGIEPNNVDAIKIRSTIYGKMNQTDKALADIKRALELTPNNPELYNNLGIIYSIQGNQEQALENFQKAVGLSPYYLQAHMNLGKLYLDRMELEKALKQLAIVYDKDPNLYYNAYLLGRTYLLMNEEEKSEVILRKFAIEETQASQIANSLYRDSLYEASITYYTIAMGDRDIRSKTLYQRAQSYKALGLNQEALDDLLALIEVVPNPQFFYEIALLFKELGNIEETCTFLHEAEKRKHPDAKKLIDELCEN